MNKTIIFITALMLLFTLSACTNNDEDSGNIKVVTTLFPQYDMVRSLAGEEVQLTLTLPPSVSPHSYEPTPKTVIEILESDLFIYSSNMLEPWIEDFLASNDTKDLIIVNLSEYVILRSEEHEEETESDDDHDHEEADPHYWSDPLNAKLMVSAIARELSYLLPNSKETIETNKLTYLEELSHLHEEFLHLEEERTIDLLMFGGHNSIGYFIHRYNITYVNPYEGFSTDAEPTPSKIANMIDIMNTYNIKHLFSEHLLSQTLANTIQEQTGADILMIYSMGSLSKQEFEDGLTFLEMFEHNLTQYRIGLGYDETNHEH